MVNYYVKNCPECDNILSCCMKPKVISKQSNKQVFFVSTILVLLFTSLHYIPYNAIAQGLSTTENLLTYTNSDYGFTIKYPSDWIVDDKNITTLGVKFMSHDSLANILISITNLQPNETRISLINMSKKIVMHPPTGFKPLEINTDSYFLSGHPAVRMVAIGSFGGPGEPGASQGIVPHVVKMMALVTNIGNKRYEVGYLSVPETYPKYLSVAQEMIDSFQAISRQ
jgi:hypothetical protein